MMLRTTDGIITIFPAIPKKFMQNGVFFKKLRSYSNHKVSGRYQDQLLSFEIKLSKPDTIKLFNNIKEEFAVQVDGDEHIIRAPLGSIIELKANKVISYRE